MAPNLIPSNAEVEAAAHTLYGFGVHYNWFPKGLPGRYDEMDPIAKEEFEAIVERVLISAAKVRVDGAPA
jgi:hypothetical protein